MFVERVWGAYERHQTRKLARNLNMIYCLSLRHKKTKNVHVHAHFYVISDALVHEYGETILGYFIHTKTRPAYGSVLVLLYLVLLYRCEHFQKHGYT